MFSPLFFFWRFSSIFCHSTKTRAINCNLLEKSGISLRPRLRRPRPEPPEQRMCFVGLCGGSLTLQALLFWDFLVRIFSLSAYPLSHVFKGSSERRILALRALSCFLAFVPPKKGWRGKVLGAKNANTKKSKKRRFPNHCQNNPEGQRHTN